MNDHQQITAERGRRAADLRAAAVALLEQQAIASGVMLDLDSDQVVAAGPKAAILCLLSNGAPAATSGDAPDLQQLKALALAADQGEGQHIYTNPRDSNRWKANEAWHRAASPAVVLGLIARIESAAAPAPQDSQAHYWMNRAHAAEQAFVHAMHDIEKLDRAVSAATKPTADLSSLTRYSMWSNGAAHGCDPAINGRWVEFDDVQSLLATKPAGVPAVPVELMGVREEIEAGSGFWDTCSGCHETEDGYPVGSYHYSEAMRCSLGNGCSECGGIGAVWDNNDYDAMAADWEKLDAAPTAAPADQTDTERLNFLGGPAVVSMDQYEPSEGAAYIAIDLDLPGSPTVRGSTVREAIDAAMAKAATQTTEGAGNA